LNTKKANEKSFFCSELIAVAYITMQILSDKFPPHTYFPVDFSSNRNLPWLKNSYLEYEYVIDMS